MHPILQKLKKGDRRSIGRSNEVVADVLANPRLFRIVFSGLFVDDPGVRMRSADVSEKVTTRRPELTLKPAVRRRIIKLTNTGTPAMKARGRKLLATL